MSYTVTLHPGRRDRPRSLHEAMRRVVDATGVKPSIGTIQDAGEAVIEQYGTPLPDHVLDSIRRNKVGIKGPHHDAGGQAAFRSVNVALRKALDLYANLRPAQEHPRRRFAL